ncbi:MAG: GMC family oxidoreductase [Deltaproteobacteria bacterium]|nr:GMC family oxidoreductase [Deltaproteobacteria bacterium]
MTTGFDAVIIGSGFGGAIPALRLAQAGKKVLVLEQGGVYTEQDFKQSWDLKYLSGFLSITTSDDYATFFRSGMVLGGGSVVFSGLMNRSPSETFQFVDYNGYKVWPDAVSRQVLDPYYDMVEQMMSVRQATWEEVSKTGGMFAKMLDNAGLTCDRARFPYINCRECGFCEAGCIYGVKQSLMHNYIPQAKAAGVEFRTGCRAMQVVPSPSGYTVQYTGPDDTLTSVDGTIAIVAAGAIYSAELLLRSKPSLPQLSDQVGMNFNNNGGIRFGLELPDGLPSIECYKGRDSAAVMTYAYWQDYRITIEAGTSPASIFSLNIHRPGMSGWGLDFKHWAKSVYPSKLIIANIMGPVTGEGYVYLNDDLPALHFPLTQGLSGYMSRVIAPIEALAKASNAVLLQTMDSSYMYSIDHMLGTCRIGDDPRYSPADPYGQIRNYPGLFVSDSSSIPCGTGVNPSTTVAANAERIADHIVRNW